MTVVQALRILDPINPVGIDEIMEIYADAENANGVALADIVMNCVKEAYEIIKNVVKMYYDDIGGAIPQGVQND
jgi:hypothetical protein